jgi:hypothetical protein
MATPLYETNAQDSFYDADQELRPVEEQKLDDGFTVINDFSIDAVAQQQRIVPRRVSVGNTRGDQKIRGRLIVPDEHEIPRVIMGWDPTLFKDGGGIKISLPGVDVLEATSTQLTLNTDDILIKQAAGFQVSIPGGTIPAVSPNNIGSLWYMPHGLTGTPPILIAHVRDDFSSPGFIADSPLPFIGLFGRLPVTGGFTISNCIRAWVDSSNVYFRYDTINPTYFGNFPAAYSYPSILIKVRLFQRTATPDIGVI